MGSYRFWYSFMIFGICLLCYLLKGIRSSISCGCNLNFTMDDLLILCTSLILCCKLLHYLSILQDRLFCNEESRILLLV